MVEIQKPNSRASHRIRVFDLKNKTEKMFSIYGADAMDLDEIVKRLKIETKKW